jgi:hypothetical protein
MAGSGRYEQCRRSQIVRYAFLRYVVMAMGTNIEDCGIRLTMAKAWLSTEGQ